MASRDETTTCHRYNMTGIVPNGEPTTHREDSGFAFRRSGAERSLGRQRLLDQSPLPAVAPPDAQSAPPLKR